MKKILFYLLFSTTMFSQSVTTDYYRSFYKKSMGLLIKDNENYKFNFYFKGEVFYISYETKYDFMESEIDYSLSQMITNSLKDTDYKIISNLIGDDEKLIDGFIKNCKVDRIYFEANITTKDYKFIKHINYINTQKLSNIIPYFNKGDFLDILNVLY